MKLKQILMVVVVILSLYACKNTLINPTAKTSLNDSQVSLLGKWNLVSDTVYAGVNTGGDPAVYKGQPGDYFNFATDGNIYIKEGTVLDTLQYQLVSGTQVDITSFTTLFNNKVETCNITTITANSAAIASPLLTPPAGPQQRKISLNR
jgi:hypothetical protein